MLVNRCCAPKSLPRAQWVAAAAQATAINPLNHAGVENLTKTMPRFAPTAEHIAVVTKKYWHTNGVRLTVGFLDNPPVDLRAKILAHMNAWAATCNVAFAESADAPKVRIARAQGDGYWSYLGTDILSIAAGQPTMNLDSFSMDTPDSEFFRVVRHETGHTLGCPHEHMRRELVNLIDPQKAIDFFGSTQGWTPQETRQQVLTPLEDGSLTGTAHADASSIMCYQIPGSITKDGQDILGGTDIDQTDFDFMANIYPKPGADAAPAAPTAAAAAMAQLQADNEVLKRAIGVLAR